MKKLSAISVFSFYFIFFVLFFVLPTFCNKAGASNIIFEDNFNDGNADKWIPITGADLWQVKEINGNKMYGARIEIGGKIIDTVGPSLGTSNYQIDFDYLPVTNPKTSTIDRNLDFRWVPDASLGGWKIYEVHFLGENKGWTNFGYPNFTSPVSLSNNQINHIKVIFQNQHMKLYLNGTEVIDYLDTTYNFIGTDKIGLRISTGGEYPTEVWFDNIVVTGLDDLTPTPTPTPTTTTTSTTTSTTSTTTTTKPTPSMNLNVPLIKQTSNPWQSQIYDSAKSWSPSKPTIHDWGCALTSATMILKYYDINKMADGSNLNPGALNSWLKKQPDGYVGNGFVNWLAISRLPKLIKSMNSINFDALEYYRENFQNNEHLTNDLMNYMPDILEVPGHFIVASGISSGLFTINDPYYDRQNLSSYDNSYASLGRYIPKNSDLSYILLVASPTLDIKAKDSLGNFVGEQYLQRPLKNDSDSGKVSGDPIKMYYFSKPETGDYQINLTSLDTQEYKITAYLYDINGNVKILEQKGIVNPKKEDNLTIKFNKLNSSSSNAIKIVTFDNLLLDIKELQSLHLINNVVANGLTDIAKNAEKNYNKGLKKVSLLGLNLFEIMLKTIKNPFLIKNDAYQILLYDINYLQKHI